MSFSDSKDPFIGVFVGSACLYYYQDDSNKETVIAEDTVVQYQKYT